MSKALVDAMRDWLKDCVWANVDDEEFFDGLPDSTIIKAVNRYYVGGVAQFERDGVPAGVRP